MLCGGSVTRIKARTKQQALKTGGRRHQFEEKINGGKLREGALLPTRHRKTSINLIELEIKKS